VSNSILGLRTRAELRAVVQNQIQNSKNSTTIVNNALDQGFRSALSRMRWPQLFRDFPTALTITSGSINFHAPKEVRDLIAVVDTTSPFFLRAASPHAMFSRARGFTNLTGQPGEFAWMGTYGIKITLDSAGEALEIVSVDGADVRTGIIEGFNAAGERKKTEFTLTGTTAVSVGTFTDVTRLQIDTQNSAATITLQKVSDSTEAATIGPEELTAEYQRYRLNSAVSQDIVAQLLYYYTPPAVINDDDMYPIPIEDYLISFAASRYYQSQHQLTLAEGEFALAERRLRDAMMAAESSTPHFASPYSPRRRPLGVIVEGLGP
jgi:hypothetical protein